MFDTPLEIFGTSSEISGRLPRKSKPSQDKNLTPVIQKKLAGISNIQCTMHNTWINLLVFGHSIGIYNGLKPLCKLVCPVKSWRLLTSSHAIQNGWYSSPTPLRATPQCLLNLIQVANWTPALGNKTFLSHIQVKHVHGVINGLDLLDLVKKIRDQNKFHLSCSR